LTEKVKEGNERESTDELPSSLLFVAIVFLIRGLYLLFISIKEFGIIPGGLFGKLLAVLGLLIGLFYFISFVGLISKKYFSLYIASVLIFIDIVFSLALMGQKVVLSFGLIFAIILLYLMWSNEKYLNKFDKNDKRILTVSALIGLLYICSLWYASTLPSESEIYDRVTKEALEKKDPMICKKLSRDGLVFDCIEELNWKLKDPKLCEMIKEGYRSNCYIDLGSKLKNETYCYKISDFHMQKVCLKNAK